jgi:hypothetical protein
MKDWIPFLQSLVWPIFILIFLFVARSRVREILAVIRQRIEAGSEMAIGPSGFTLGSAPKLKTPIVEIEQELLQSLDIEVREPVDGQQQFSPELAQFIYLIHGASYYREAGPTSDRRDFYTVMVQLSADSLALLDKVQKVVYYRHPGFKEKTILEVADRESNFQMITRVWGQFNLKADVFFEGISKPLTLYRYLNF